ncbi:hypothetical protein E4U30_000652 [Claviceps sp. LM220 group G6]|nr:hypothetical protein E4U15_008014 [Claviceps sp. LM218 group G6]KAG6097410.1 hypothetical protein E4U30_000652 [Claviceps sp. LM220 group G6]KAG6109780.1 hypothetical protein E4U14_003098 [Claviceps sp. LM454 group G7]
MSRLVAHIASHVRVVSTPMWSYFYQGPVSLKLTELAPRHEKATTLSAPDPD